MEETTFHFSLQSDSIFQKKRTIFSSRNQSVIRTEKREQTLEHQPINQFAFVEPVHSRLVCREMAAIFVRTNMKAKPNLAI